MKCREQAQREASPTAAIIDSQSVKSAEPFDGLRRGASIDPHGGACPWAGRRPDPRDAGKKINGRKRHILVDTLGLLLHAIVHPADIQDRDGGVLLLATLFGMYPFLKKLFADGGYQGPEFQKALKKVLPYLETEIVKRSDGAKGFVLLARRWVVERTFPPDLIRGSIAVAGSPRTGRTSIEKRSPSCASPQSASCSEDFVIPHEVTG